jgi:deoxyribodipyrimidine photolyase-related protein
MADAVGQSLDRAYAHHIQRLMVTGNFALLAGVDPDEVDRWYLGVYIDAVEWVEKPNTRAMSQWADGGIVATKPYVSSARYIDRMSDYCGGCRYDKNDRSGDRACPFNSLYWDFFARHRDKLEKNPRIGMMVRTWDRMKPAEKEKTLARAAGLKRDLDGL